MCVCVCLGMCLKSVCMYIWSPFVSFTEIYTGTYIIDTTLITAFQAFLQQAQQAFLAFAMGFCETWFP